MPGHNSIWDPSLKFKNLSLKSYQKLLQILHYTKTNLRLFSVSSELFKSEFTVAFGRSICALPSDAKDMKIVMQWLFYTTNQYSDGA